MKAKKILIMGIIVMLLASTASAGFFDWAHHISEKVGPGGMIGIEIGLMLVGKVTDWQYWRLGLGRTLDDNFMPTLEGFLTNNLVGERGIVLMEPPLRHPDIWNTLTYFIGLLQPFYILGILITGLYLIFFSGSPKGRARAKSLLPRLIVSMVVVSLSPYILQMFFDVVEATTNEILGRCPTNPTGIFLIVVDYLMAIFHGALQLDVSAAHPFFLFVFILILATFATFALRYIVLIALTLIFPLTLFLYSFNVTRGIGRTLLEQTIVWKVMEITIVLVLLVVNIGMMLLNVWNEHLIFVAGLMAWVMFIISPLMTLMLLRRFLP